MEKNIGSIDKAIRILTGITVALLYYFNIISGTLAFVLMVVAIILLVTSLINSCPIYSLLKINSTKKEK
ncbi:DUF2892 domain-containing protein [Algibacter miyuki]|uniref:DUF2892 domain-containing protein n=1 Tax=Algibacter miyuki TaxID=1306933 RepID=A0ABV5H3V6_9FLAO|nr:DUF2892 domain-containing protein [Algibacter miyuki]MDN3664215.1 DUF2892 domain-containing protein [Algibacter miyuki]MDN3665650.1 DUF2892 domain-containing protein [Algibacter miyuki]MDN3667674.1 DUF2892 domain-containing protein [Algibacter miyuki]MDN3667689.1 DUF2892 domain-containing protein [Algibacter miyuki]